MNKIPVKYTLRQRSRLWQVFKASYSSLTKCPPEDPSHRRIIVTILGANSPVGKIVGLLLKQNQYIDELRLFAGDKECCGIAFDLSHIDTNTKIRAYPGYDLLKYAIEVGYSISRLITYYVRFRNHMW